MLVDVILPLALEKVLTYNLPDILIGKYCIGMRVLVPIGNKKIQTGIVYRIHKDNLPDNVVVKDIICCLDEAPIILPSQLKLWEWIAEYYVCTLGEVMKAALPAALKLESETCVCINPNFESYDVLSKQHIAILDFLNDGKEHNINEITKSLGIKTILPALNKLLDLQAVKISEKVEEKYKEKFETLIKIVNINQVEDTFQSLNRAKSQQHLLSVYLELTDYKDWLISKSLLLEKSGSSAAILKNLLDKNILEEHKVQIDRNPVSSSSREAFPLSNAQQSTYNQIVDLWQTKQVVLLHGVTSSGKTEIYIKLIQKAIQEGKQVLYLVPEIALTTQLTERLQRVFGDLLGVYHSKFSDAERVEVYQNLLNQKRYKVILGVRSSIFLPFSNLGLVIVDEEHDPSYKQQEPSPRYHARNAAIVLAQFLGAKTLLGTATPALETYYNATTTKYGLVSLTERFKGLQLPHVTLVDTKLQYHRHEMQGHFSTYLIERIQQELAANKQVIIFQNRRGYVPVLTCKKCGYVPKCVNCDVSLTVHKRFNRLTCHYCGYSIPIPAACPSCQSELIEYGLGTEKVEEECQQLFPNARVARMDLDTTRKKGDCESIITDFAEHKIDILIGTQMISKGLHFDDVSLVAVVHADSMLNQPDFRCVERTYQMLAQVAGRAGRNGKQGEVIIQTSNAHLPLYSYLNNYDYSSFYQEELAERKLFKYPPFYHLIDVSVRHHDFNSANQTADLLQQHLSVTFGGRCSKVIVPNISRVQGQYVRQIMIKIENSASFMKAKSCLMENIQYVKQQPFGKSSTISINVDPL